MAVQVGGNAARRRAGAVVTALAAVVVLWFAAPVAAVPAPPGPTAPGPTAPGPTAPGPVEPSSAAAGGTGEPGATTGREQVSPREGQAAKDRLDARSERAPDNVVAWYVEAGTNQTVVSVVGPVDRAAEAFVADRNPAAVRVAPMSDPIRPLAPAQAPPAPAQPTAAPSPLVGGTAIVAGGTRCSIGATATRGATTFLLTAGHCSDGEVGSQWSAADGRPIGPVVRARYPGEDYALIEVADPALWRASGRVEGGPTLRGSTPAAVGDRVCRSGSTSGYRCGRIQSMDVTVNYGGGNVVRGLVQSSACAEPGDSGGTALTPTGQAQGLLSGGSGDCAGGGLSFFQPLVPVLDFFGLTLVTAP